MEPVYRATIAVAQGMWALQGVKFTDVGFENFPTEGGAVVAINHTGYLDFPIAGRPAWYRSHRYMRFMGKKELFDHKISGPLMRAYYHIPVDRSAGAGAYQEALTHLRAGELIGVYPEATHSRSFELRDFKSGAARLALEAGVPIAPVVVWGAQQIWTNGHPKALGRNHFKIITGCPPILEPTGTPDELTARLKGVMHDELRKLQDIYGEHPKGAFWVPQRLGGSAPTPEQAEAMYVAEAKERSARNNGKPDGGYIPPQ